MSPRNLSIIQCCQRLGTKGTWFLDLRLPCSLHMPAPPGSVEVAPPFRLQPLQVRDCCLAWAALPADAEDCPRPAGVGVAAIIPAVRAAWFWLAPGGAPCAPATAM
eukprot:4548127-Pyramimonas_sp.AAC.1